MTEELQVNERQEEQEDWDTFGRYVEDTYMLITFDNSLSKQVPIEGYDLCARILIPIHETKPGTSTPIDAEGELLNHMEDELFDLLGHEAVQCRFVARLTYDGLRELVYQVKDLEAFRPVVGGWIGMYDDYDIDVSEHDGWSFYESYIYPNEDERRFMAENRVIHRLVESGSDPGKPHDLEYHFRGEESVLKQLFEKLTSKGYKLVGESDFSSGQITLSTAMVLDPHMITEESRSNARLAASLSAEMDGWGATVVS